MNKLWYNLSGIFIILAGIIGSFFVIKYNGLFFGGIYSIGILAVSFLHAFFYFNIGRGKVGENKLIKSSLILTIITLTILVLELIISFMDFDDTWSWAITLLFVGFIAGVFYMVVLLLLVIHWFLNRNKQS